MFKMIYNIARTELQMLFYSPVAWLILVVFGVQSGMLFADQLAGLVSAQEMGYDIQGSTISIFANRWGGVFTTMQNYLYFYIPLLTMSLVSKELSSGSIRLLYSSPITNTQIIVGKFFSMMIYGLIMIGILFLITLCSWAIVKDFDPLLAELLDRQRMGNSGHLSRAAIYSFPKAGFRSDTPPFFAAGMAGRSGRNP